MARAHQASPLYNSTALDLAQSLDGPTILGISSLLGILEERTQTEHQEAVPLMAARLESLLTQIYAQYPSERSPFDPEPHEAKTAVLLLGVLMSAGSADSFASQVHALIGDKDRQQLFDLTKTLLISQDEAPNGTGTPYRLTARYIPLIGRAYSFVRAHALLSTISAPADTINKTLTFWAETGCLDTRILETFLHSLDTTAQNRETSTESTNSTHADTTSVPLHLE